MTYPKNVFHWTKTDGTFSGQAKTSFFVSFQKADLKCFGLKSAVDPTVFYCQSFGLIKTVVFD